MLGAIVTTVPDLGSRSLRLRRSYVANLPNREIVTNSPCTSAEARVFRNEAMIVETVALLSFVSVAILATRSPLFTGILRNETTGRKDSRVSLKEVIPEN